MTAVLAIGGCSPQPEAHRAAVSLIAAQEAKLTPGDGAANDTAGWSVGISGDTAVVGAPSDDSKGSVYVFARSGASWAQQAKLTASDGATGDQFGIAVAVSGGTIVVGASDEDDRGSGAGAAYLFARSGTSWAAQGKVTAEDGAAGDFLGSAVAVSGDTAVVAATGSDAAALNAGAAYVFARSGTLWSQQARLTAADAASTVFLGTAVGVSGSTALVGATGDDERGRDAGAAYVFTRSGTAWAQQAKLTATDAAAFDDLGFAVAASGDSAVVGARSESARGRLAGAAYVFVRTGTTWMQQAKLTANDGAASDYFGSAAAMEGDTLVVGALQDDDRGFESGSAYVFTRSGTTWTQEAKLTAADGAGFDYYAFSVAVSGSRVLSGAYGDDDNGSFSGAAYVHTVSPNPDLEAKSLTASVSGGTATIAGTVCSHHAASTSIMRLWLDRGSAPGCSAGGADAEEVLALSQDECASFSVSVPVPAGSYTAQLQIDGDCTVAEDDETNNVTSAAYATPFDLSVKSFNAAVAGGMVTLTGEFCHSGAAMAGTFQASLWANLPATPNCATAGADGTGDVAIPTNACAPIQIGPAALPAGTYASALLIDSDCALVEGDETNNAGAASFTIP